jgi:tetratricopeptide (TPR) repeat protein
VIRRLHYFLAIDDAARQRAALLSAGAGLIPGMLLQWYGEPFDVSAYFSLAVASAVFTLRIWLYCRKANSRVSIKPVVGGRAFKSAAVAAAVFILCVLPAPRVEAHVLDHRLRALTPGAPLTSDAPKKITDTLELAQRLGLPVPSTTLVRVRNAIKGAAVNSSNLDELPPAADALASYGRSLEPHPTSRGAEALEEMRLAGRLAQDAAIGHRAVDEAEANAAVEAYTRAVDLSDGDHFIQSRALLARAGVLALLGRFDEAYTDAKRAEALDSTDLYPIVLLEGIVLATHAKEPADLRQATGLLKLAAKMRAPSDLASSQIMAVTTLAEVYYDLGQYKDSCATALPGLPSAPSLLRGALYQLLSLCYLRSGEYEQALTIAKAYAARGDDPRSTEWLELVSNYPEDRSSTLNLLEKKREPLHLTLHRS